MTGGRTLGHTARSASGALGADTRKQRSCKSAVYTAVSGAPRDIMPFDLSATLPKGVFSHADKLNVCPECGNRSPSERAHSDHLRQCTLAVARSQSAMEKRPADLPAAFHGGSSKRARLMDSVPQPERPQLANMVKRRKQMDALFAKPDTSYANLTSQQSFPKRSVVGESSNTFPSKLLPVRVNTQVAAPLSRAE
ncbi:hypothetical protein K488DRAFT_75175 [Vararia minispora EC-137]|uniref:Uncharacterized protein n=1 Tax=Vararia minispora EC-137 TaxID=1314806 RepID=A0ACB8Q4H5_9AGAM|nr:hypothetical protein K488DRAFT_75175 [Vararia minispora EC-137]